MTSVAAWALQVSADWRRYDGTEADAQLLMAWADATYSWVDSRGRFCVSDTARVEPGGVLVKFLVGSHVTGWRAYTVPELVGMGALVTPVDFDPTPDTDGRPVRFVPAPPDDDNSDALTEVSGG